MRGAVSHGLFTHQQPQNLFPCALARVSPHLVSVFEARGRGTQEVHQCARSRNRSKEFSTRLRWRRERMTEALAYGFTEDVQFVNVTVAWRFYFVAQTLGRNEKAYIYDVWGPNTIIEWRKPGCARKYAQRRHGRNGWGRSVRNSGRSWHTRIRVAHKKGKGLGVRALTSVSSRLCACVTSTRTIVPSLMTNDWRQSLLQAQAKQQNDSPTRR